MQNIKHYDFKRRGRDDFVARVRFPGSGFAAVRGTAGEVAEAVARETGLELDKLRAWLNTLEPHDS